MLSNFTQSGDRAGADDSAVQYRPVREEELTDALGLILGSASLRAPATETFDFAQFAAVRGIELQNMWVAARNGGLLWALLPVISPGRTMLLLAPTFFPVGVDVAPVTQAACKWFGECGGHLAQALTDPADPEVRSFYTRQGFVEIAELLYLQANVPTAARPPAIPQGLHWLTYSRESHALFARAILQSYRNSLDCPLLNGLRDIEDIMAGHLATGEMDPRWWFVLLEGNDPCGVLLLSRVPRNDLAELVYVGLAPQARGRGIGDLLIRQGIWAARQMGVAHATLAVDSRNQPALKLYYRHGMRRIGSKTALIRDLRTTPAQPLDSPTIHSQVR